MQTDTGQVPSADEVRDRLAIGDLLVQHSRGLDRGHTGLIRATYWGDAEVDYGSFVGSAHEFADMVVPILKEKYRSTQHKIGTTTVDLSGDRCLTETYVTAHHLHRGEEREMIFHGRYLDRFERRAGIWKIAHRRVVMDWHRLVSVEADPDDPALAPIVRGGQGEADASMPFFLAADGGGA